MKYPHEYTERTMAATLRKLKRKRRIPQKRRSRTTGRWRWWRENFSESAWITRMLSRRMR